MKKLITALTFLAVGSAQAVIIFEQDFSYSNTKQDYYTEGDGTGTATGGKFDLIGEDDEANPSANISTAINSGALEIVNLASPTGSGGFAYTGFESSPPDQAVFNFSYTMNPRPNNDFDFAPAAGFIIGNAGNVDSPIDSGTSAAGSFLELTFRVTGGNAGNGGTFRIENSGEAAILDGLVSSTTYEFALYLNRSGGDLNYLGADGMAYNLTDRQYSLFYNDGSGWDIAFDDIEGRALDSNPLSDPEIDGFRYKQGKENFSATFDNFSVNNEIQIVPEPATAILLGVFGLAFMLQYFRRK